MNTVHRAPSSGLPNRTMAYELQRKKNQRMALILASVAVVFFIGFVAKMALLS